MERYYGKKLTADDVKNIRILAERHNDTRISRYYGVSKIQIRRIRLGNQWKHVGGELHRRDTFLEGKGEELRKLRLEAGVYQKEIAYAIGRHISTISNYEANKYRIPLHVWNKIDEFIQSKKAVSKRR